MPKLALKLGIQTYQIFTNDDEVCIPSLSSILLAVMKISLFFTTKNIFSDMYILQPNLFQEP